MSFLAAVLNILMTSIQAHALLSGDRFNLYNAIYRWHNAAMFAFIIFQTTSSPTQECDRCRTAIPATRHIAAVFIFNQEVLYPFYRHIELFRNATTHQLKL